MSLSVLPNICQLNKNITRILAQNPGPFTLQGTNTYLIGDRDLTLIDTGEGKVEYLNLLKDFLNEKNANLKQIILSHYHYDHCNGVVGIIESKDIKKTEDFKIYKYYHPTDEKFNFNYTKLNDNDIIQTDDDVNIRIVHTPGHTSDHVSLMIEEEGILFSGDCILGESTSVFTDLHTYLQSLEKLLKYKPDKIYPGHGKHIDNGIEKIVDYINHRNIRENQIFESLNQDPQRSLTASEIVPIIYDTSKFSNKIIAAATNNVILHLFKLEIENKVIRIENENENDNNSNNNNNNNNCENEHKVDFADKFNIKWKILS